MPPFIEEESVDVHPSTGGASVPGFFPVFKKSRKEVMKPDFSSEDFSSVELESFCMVAQASGVIWSSMSPSQDICSWAFCFIFS